MKPVSVWDAHPELADLLRALWNVKGLSASMIADQMGHGLSRSSILGKVRRMNLATRTPGGLYSDQPKIRRQKMVTLPKRPTVEPPTFLGEPGQFPPRGTCQYTPNDVNGNKDWRMCGQPGHPWCDFHKTIVFAPQHPARQAAE